MKTFGFIFIFFVYAFISKAQTKNCILQSPQYTIHFGAGNIADINTSELSNFKRVSSMCPSDGYYSFVSYTSSCFRNDWHTITEDHTAGDAGGNMMLVNATEGTFLKTTIRGLKSNTVYQVGVWLMNLCKPTKKCPYPLLPRLNIRLETPEGTIVANIVTGELPRFEDPKWIQHHAFFTTPASTSTLILVMTNNAPRGCGNDFTLDDITFRECVKATEAAKETTKTKINVVKQQTVPKQTVKKITTPDKKQNKTAEAARPKTDTISKTNSLVKPEQKIFPPPPLILKTRENTLAKKFETDAGEIKIELYDNGEIDGDTVSIYHNNQLVRSHMRLSQRPISITISVNESQPHHEMIMVAENLGSIPPNTSVMMITTANGRYQVFITSTEQKNAKVVFDLKK